MVRNRVKRRVKEVVRAEKGKIKEGFDLIINIKELGAKARFEALKKEFLLLAQRGGLLHDEKVFFMDH